MTIRAGIQSTDLLDGLNAPYYAAVAVVPADGADLAVAPTRALYIGVAGTLTVDTIEGSTVAFANVVAGVLPIRVKRVRATGTAATGIVALY